MRTRAKLFELRPGDLFNFEYDSPYHYAMCIALCYSPNATSGSPVSVTYLYKTDKLEGVVTIELHPLTNVGRL